MKPKTLLPKTLLTVTLLALSLPSVVQLATVERPLQSGWWLERWALDAYAPWAFARLPRGSGEVVRGRGDRLFHTESLRYLRGVGRVDPEHPDRASRRAIESTQRQLEAQGVELLVVLVPPKAALVDEPQTWSDGPREWSGLASWKAALEERGVRLLDLTEALRDMPPPRYLRHDTHWSPETARAAAQHVAEFLEVNGLRPDAPRSEFDHREVRVRARGDLAELLPGGHALERQELSLTQVALTYDGQAPIGAVDSPVLLLGDSFTLAFSDPRLGLGRQAGFAEHLADALALPLDVVAIPGGAATQARRAVAARSAGLEGKRLVVWQIAQRDILRARDGWHDVDLSVSTAAAASPTSASVEARIRLLPHDVPRTIDYADCLVLLPFERTAPAPELPERFTVAAWGWRDFEALSPLDLRPGDEIDVALSPLESAVSLETTCWMGDLGATSYFAAEGL